MAQPKQGPLQKSSRKLDRKIDGRDVYVTQIVNDDLDRVEELTDESDELIHEQQRLREELKELEDADERKEMLAKIRDLSRQRRVFDLQTLAIYVEDKDGAAFDDETLASLPVADQIALITQAAKHIYGTDEGPTPAVNAT
jgi:hypothetical protein